MLSVVDGRLTPVPWEDLDPAMVQEIQRDSDGYTLSVLKDGLRPQDAVETTLGGDEYVVSDITALTPSFLHHVPSPPARAPASTLSPPFRCRWNVRGVKSRTPRPPRHASHDTATNTGQHVRQTWSCCMQVCECACVG